MSDAGMGEERGARAARARALAVLRVRGRAVAVALLPVAVAVVLWAGPATGHLRGGGWDAARWLVTCVAVPALLAAAAVATVIARARPALSPTVEIAEESAPDLYRLVEDLAVRLDVPVPSAIALTPDCDSWLEDRTHRAHRIPGAHRHDAAPVLVIGSPFLWWMRVGELRAVLAPVVAGTGPSAHPDIAAARRFVRGLDAAVAVEGRPGLDPVRRLGARGVAAAARLLLRGCQVHVGEMERGVASAASERAQTVDYGLRIVAQEQVGLAYAGWDRLLTRVALPAWRMGRWPCRLDAGVVSALTELSRRDRLAEGFASRLGERPACDLLEEPGLVDEAASLLAARLFHGGPPEVGPDWAPVDWQQYPDEVVDRKWRTEAARLHRALDRLGVRSGAAEPTLSRVLDHLTTPETADPLAAAITATLAAEEEAPPRSAPWPDLAPGPLLPQPPAAQAPPASGAPRTTGTASPDPAPAAPAAGTRADFRADSAPAAPSTPHAAPSTPHAAPSTPHAAPSTPHAAPSTPHAAPSTPHAAPSTSHADPAPQTPAPPGADPAGAHRTPTAATWPDAATAAAPRPAPAGAAPPGPPTPGSGPGAAPPGPVDEAPTPGTGSGPRPGPDAAPAQAPAPAPVQRPASAPAPTPADASAPGVPAVSAVTAVPAAGHPAEIALGWAGGGDPLPLFPLQPPRTGRDLLVDHVTAMVCCAAVDTAGAAPGLDWLDGPALLVDGKRTADLAGPVLTLIEDADPRPLRDWLAAVGVRPEKPVRLR
ncbi:hypothetical protein ACF1G0_14735 [Streptomyces sp. NPDC013953]|uniref:hypothetical protein n=1 Tax=Streptomyces sp. NPDC013953 TaxID=3364868 RepID=UPI0037008517